MSKVKAAVLLSLLVGVASSNVRAEEIVYKDESGKSKVTLVSQPGKKGRYWVMWENLPIDNETGGGIYDKEESKTRTSYYPSGHAGYFSIENKGAKTLVNGTLTSTVNLIHSNEKPLVMILSPDKGASVDSIQAAYRTSENFPESSTTREQAQKNIDEKLKEANAACKSKWTFNPNWSSFSGGKTPLLPNVGISILEGLKRACSDADYQAELAKMKVIELQPLKGGDWKNDFSVKKESQKIVVSIGDEVANPTMRTEAWVKEGF